MSTFFEAFLDGVTGAGLFGKLRWPGAPTEIIDSRSVEEFLASGDFERSMESLGYHREEVVEENFGVLAPRPTITIKGRNGAMGVLSADGERITWYVNGVEVRGSEVLLQQDQAEDFKLHVNKSVVGGSFIEHLREHAGRR